MGVEIERKFLVEGDSWRQLSEQSEHYEQGYLADTGSCSVRVRLEGERARLNIKSAGLDIQRMEFEYPIPVEDAHEILEQLCGTCFVKKTRHFIKYDDLLWEVDEFLEDNAGLVVAEIELETRDQEFQRPDWLGAEVSGDPRYMNNNLAKSPFKDW